AVERDRPAAAIPPARRGAVLQLVPFVEFEEQLRADEGGGDEADDGEIFVALGHGRPSIALRRRRRNRRGRGTSCINWRGRAVPCRPRRREKAWGSRCDCRESPAAPGKCFT